MQDRIKLIKKQLLEHLEQENERGLQNLFEITHPSDLGAVLEMLDIEPARQIFPQLPRERQVEVVEEISPVRTVRLFRSFEDEQAVRILQEISPDDAADVFLTLDKSEQERLLSKIDDDEFRRTLIDLISYPADSAGGIMTTEYLAVGEDLKVQEAIDAARRRSEDTEMIYYIYTVDEDNRISGVLSMRELIQTDPSRPVRELASRDLVKVRVDDDQEQASQMLDRYGLLAVPVVDHQDRLRGIITVDDAVGILEKEATEDIYKQAGISPYEEMETQRHMRVTQASFWTNLTIRIPWLIIVCIGALLAGSMMSFYEEYLTRQVELAFFVPVVMAMGGNVGSQSTTIFVRGVIVGQIDLADFWKHLASEIYKTGLGVGIFFGILVGLSTWTWQVYSRGAEPLQHAVEMGLAVGSSMFLTIVAASAMGFVVPWAVYKSGVDPATASHPLLTTLQDIVGILIYFTCATFFLSQL